jgi:hypothetical protein
MALSSQSFPQFIEEFRILKLESLKKDLHKLNSDELHLIKRELDFLLNSKSGGSYE